VGSAQKHRKGAARRKIKPHEESPERRVRPSASAENSGEALCSQMPVPL
jgi:hypothetical protein